MKRALVTGAADGIGLALTRQLAQAGYAVVGVDCNRERLDQVRHAIPSARWLEIDLLDADAVDRILDAMETNERFDLVVLNAGISIVGPFETQERAAFGRVVQVNLSSPTLLARELLARKRIEAGGTIVFLSSLSTFVGYPGGAVYAGTKAGLASLSRSLRVALVQQGIRTLTVYPGPTRTQHARRYSPSGSPEERRMPPEEVARAILTAARKGRRWCIPGWSNLGFALAGYLLPALTDRLMRRTLYQRLARERSSP